MAERPVTQAGQAARVAPHGEVISRMSRTNHENDQAESVDKVKFVSKHHNPGNHGDDLLAGPSDHERDGARVLNDLNPRSWQCWNAPIVGLPVSPPIEQAPTLSSVQNIKNAMHAPEPIASSVRRVWSIDSK